MGSWQSRSWKYCVQRYMHHGNMVVRVHNQNMIFLFDCDMSGVNKNTEIAYATIIIPNFDIRNRVEYGGTQGD